MADRLNKTEITIEDNTKFVDSISYINKLIPSIEILEKIKTLYYQGNTSNFNNDVIKCEKAKTGTLNIPFYRTVILSNSKILVTENEYTYCESFKYKDNQYITTIIIDYTNPLANLADIKMTVDIGDILFEAVF